MSYYDTRTNTPRGPRRLEVKLSDGALLGPPDTGWTSELLALCGLVEVVEVPRPADTVDTTYDRSVALVADVPTVVWTARPYTADELAAQQRNTNANTIDQAITNALTQLQALIDAPAVAAVPDGTLTTATLSNAMRSMRDAVQANRAGAQQVALTLKRTIRVVRGDFDGVD